jgi:PleD family two-component response regulator
MATVMVVEDVQIIRETVAKLLRREGFATVMASNGEEALDALSQIKPDLVLLDIMMPKMDGLTCLQRMRETPGSERLPVIIMTAVEDSAVSDRAKGLGVNDFLVKTHFTIGEMLQKVRDYVSGDN